VDVLANIQLGLSVALSWDNLALCFVGCLLGTLIGVLPGIGPLPTMAMLLPVTFRLEPTGALIMLAGVFYGAQYGGSTTAILMRLPGETSSLVTVLDGYALAQKGRAGIALTMAAYGSVVAGILSTIVVAIGAPFLARVALLFQSADYVSVMVLGLVAAVVLASGSILKALAAITFGALLGLVGTDNTTGEFRLTMGLHSIADGLGFVPIAMGLFGLAEIAHNLEQTKGRGQQAMAVGRLLPSVRELLQTLPAILRSTAVGAAFGILPGGGPTISAFAAYSLEKRIAKNPEEFGKGALEGVAAPEAANNAAAQTCFIPMLSLGIPPNAIMALMIGAMMIHGITPGPAIISKQPSLFWGMVVSMLIGNIILVILNLPLIGVWVRLLRMPYRLLFPTILVFCCIGTYTVSNSVADVVIMVIFGVIGYVMRKLDCEPTPLLLGLVLAPLLEENFRRTLIASGGDASVFFTRPISLGFLIISAVLLATMTMSSVRKRRSQVFNE
jgi:putative tricarboxylic transport membrane protein